MTPRGRPKLEEPRNKLVQIRLTETEHKQVTESAKDKDMTISDMGRLGLLKEAKRKTK